MKQRRASTAPDDGALPHIPNKQRFYVAEVAQLLAGHVSIPVATATSRVYRGIENGTVVAHRYLGVTMIERAEVERIMRGERV